MLEHHVVHPFENTRITRVKIFVRGIQPLVDVVIGNKEMMEGHEFLSGRIEVGRDPRRGDCRDCDVT